MISTKQELAEFSVRRKYENRSKMFASIAVAGLIGGYSVTAFAPRIARTLTEKPTLPQVDYVRQPLEEALEIYSLDKEYEIALKSRTKRIALGGLTGSLCSVALIPFIGLCRKKEEDEISEIRKRYASQRSS